MQWQNDIGLTPEELFRERCNNIAAVPNAVVIDVVAAGGMEEYARTLTVESKDELYEILNNVVLKTVAEPVFLDQKTSRTFPACYEFYTYCRKLLNSGNKFAKLDAIADSVFNGELVQRTMTENCKRCFSVEYDEERWLAVVKRMQDVYKFSEKDIDALRYFVCQCKRSGIGEINNPSLNKALYIWGEMKKTGKTTFAKFLVSALNGEPDWRNAEKYSTSFGAEVQFGDHDLPKACTCNCSYLDEAMPRDTTKSYATLKQVLTSSSARYNPKYQHAMTIGARRNYIFTSNDDIADFIQDEKERRFYAFEFKGEPEQLTEPELWAVILEFVQQAQPREDMSLQKWYNSFQSVDGIVKKEYEAILNEFKRSPDTYFKGSTVTAWGVAKLLYKNEPTREQRKIVSRVMEAYYGDCKYSNTSMYSCSQIMQRLLSNNDSVIIGDKDLPF